MSKFLVYTEDGEQSIKNEVLIEHLEQDGYSVIGDGIHTLDYEGNLMLKQIIEKFLVSDIFARKKLYEKVIKETVSLDEINNFDLFYHLEQQSFDFLDHIDTQEIISHIEAVGYYVTESSKH